MNKKVLAIFYSQTGQLAEIIDSITAPLKSNGHSVELVRVQPEQTYPFPWTKKVFFEQMPDCVLGNDIPLQPFQLKEQAYDLIILGYQAWFLSPSLPTNAILNHPDVKNIIKNTPVVTVTGARNMWISAMERIKPTLKALQGKLVGNIALVDNHSNFISLVSLSHWMFSGKKDRYLNIFPQPGVAEKDISNASIFGTIIQSHLEQNNWDNMQNELLANKASEVKYRLMFIEAKARKIFGIWAKFISKRKNKNAWLVAFKFYLLIALLLAAPIILTIDAILFKPFKPGLIKRQKQYYSGVN